MWKLPNIFTFVCDDGTNIHIDSGTLRKWCINNKKLEIFLAPMRYDVAAEMIRDNVVSYDRVIELSKRKNLDPIIMCKDGTIGSNGEPNVMIVDGHHRYFLAAVRRAAFIETYFLELEQWKPFQLHGLPNVTQDELRKSPITKRDY